MKSKDIFKRLFLLGMSVSIFTLSGFAQADHVPFKLSQFEIDTDANLVQDHAAPSKDWIVVAEARQVDGDSGSSDNAFGQGSKEDTPVPTVVTGSIPPNKSDLKTFGIYLEERNGKRYMHLFWHRVQDPSGTTNMDFEFNQGTLGVSSNGVTPVRLPGDILLQYDLSNGGTNPELFLSKWLDGTENPAVPCEATNKFPCWSAKDNLTGALDATGSINTSFITGANSDLLDLTNGVDPRTFGEATIDFDVFAGGGEEGCKSFGSAYLKSRSSDSFTSALKDFIAPLALNLDNCATLKITKLDDTDPGTPLVGATFEVWADASLADNASGPNYAIDGKDDGLNPAGRTYDYSCTTDLTPTSCYFENVLAGRYWIVEKNAPTGHVLATPPYQLEEVVVGGEDAEVVFINPRQPQLRLIKATDPTNDPGKFDLSDSVEGLKVDEGGNGADSGFFYTTTGSHTILEAAGNGSTSLGDYDSKVSCDSSKGSNDPGINHTFNLAYGDKVTCTFTNSRLPQLKLVKATVPTTDLGTFDLSDDVAGLKVDNGGNGADSGFFSTAIGSHTVSEADGGASLSDYGSKVECDSSKGSNDPGINHTFNLAYGDKVTCTFTNTRRGTIIVEKLAPSYSSSAEFDFAGDITAKLKHGEKSTGVSVEPGQYTATETVPTGWDLTKIICDDSASTTASSGDFSTGVATFNVEAGETVTCTFTNIPLTDITVSAKSLAPGGTNSTITCTPEGGPEVGGNPTLTLSNKAPGTYVCTVVVDGGGS